MRKRIKQVRQHENLTQEEFAKRLNLTRNFIWMVENGRNNVSERTIADICREFHVNEHWLRTGEGEPYSQSDTFSLDEFCKERGASELEIKVVKAFFSLNDNTRKDILENFASIFKSLPSGDSSSSGGGETGSSGNDIA